MVALVTATGGDTPFGRTARLVADAGAVSHFQKVVLAIGDYLIYLSLALMAVLVLVQLFRHAPPLDLVQFALILTVASIPVAMPAVLSVTMAVGALALSKLKAIVSRPQSIEEMAGVDILCSDGLMDILLAVVFLWGWPQSSLWMVGLFVGISLIFDGWALVMIGWSLKHQESTRNPS